MEGSLSHRLRTRLRRSLRPPRRAIPTVPGLFALGAPTFLGLAAVTATNNLLFLILGATLGAIVLSGILSERNLRPLKVQLRPLGHVYAGEDSRVEVLFLRDKDTGPAYDLRFREDARTVFPWRRRRKPPDVLDVHLPILMGREERAIGSRCFEKRGVVSLELSELSTRFPFGLLIKAKDVEPHLDVRVRPRKVNRPAKLARPPGVSDLGEAAEHRGGGLDIYGLREKAAWDSEHRVHALRSLALGKQVVLEMTGTQRPLAEIGLAVEGADPTALEFAIELAQSALLSWEKEGFAVGLTTSSRSFAPGTVDVDVLIDHLVDVELSAPARPSRCPSSWLVPHGAQAPPDVTVFDVDRDGALTMNSSRAAA